MLTKPCLFHNVLIEYVLILWDVNFLHQGSSFLDFAKACDTIPTYILSKKLLNYGIRHGVLDTCRGRQAQPLKTFFSYDAKKALLQLLQYLLQSRFCCGDFQSCNYTQLALFTLLKSKVAKVFQYCANYLYHIM